MLNLLPLLPHRDPYSLPYFKPQSSCAVCEKESEMENEREGDGERERDVERERERARERGERREKREIERLRGVP